MRASTKVGAYGLALAAMLGGGAAIGATVGPIDTGGDASQHDGGAPDSDALPAGGLLVSQDGYAFEPEDRAADAGEFAFTITGPDGLPVDSYESRHDRELHLVIASSDLRTFVHVHPEREDGGRWSVELPSLPPGSYRAFADFQPSGGDQYVLGVDLVAPGSIDVAPPLEPRTTAAVGGFQVTLDHDAGAADQTVSVTVRREGAVVTTEPYLGAAGHLVALRQGDLAYLHVHPLDGPAGPVRFRVEVPSAGTYALFFDFQVAGVVHTAPFVIEVTPARSRPGNAHDGADTH